jgi:hypothetical protein
LGYQRIKGDRYGIHGKLCTACYVWCKNNARDRAKAEAKVKDAGRIRRPYAPCARCGKPGGELGPDDKRPDRISAVKFGVNGKVCKTCYNRITWESEAKRRGLPYTPRAVPRPIKAKPEDDARYIPTPAEIRSAAMGIVHETLGQLPGQETAAETAQRMNARRAELERQAIAMRRRKEVRLAFPATAANWG